MLNLMSGNAHWFVGVIFAVGFLGIALLVQHALRASHLVFRRRRFVCPASNENVDAVLVAESEETPFIGVRKCSPYGDGPVSCDKACLRGLNTPHA